MIGVDTGGLPYIGTGGCGPAIDGSVPSIAGLAGFEQDLAIAVEYPEIMEAGDSYDQWAEDIVATVAIGGEGIGDVISGPV